MKKIVLTGANGFIGKKLTEIFLQKGYKVIALTSGSQSYKNKNLEYIKCPMSEYINISKLIDPLEKYEAFIHLGWQSTSGNERNNFNIQFMNFNHSKTLFEQIRNTFNFKQVIGIGSILEDEFLIDNLNNQNSNLNYYGMFKMLTKKTMFSIFENSNIKSNWIKFIHIYGPGDNNNRFIQSTLIKIIQNQELHFSSGTQFYDFIYVDDAVELIYLIINASLNSQTITLSTNKKHNLMHYINLITKTFNIKSNIYFDLNNNNNHLPINKFIEENQIIKNYMFKYTFEQGIKETHKALIS